DLAPLRPLIDQCTGNQPLHPRRPFGIDDAGLECRHPDFERLDRTQRCDRKTGIIELMPPEQLWRREVHQGGLVLINPPPAHSAAAVYISRLVIGSPALTCSQCSSPRRNSASLAKRPPPFSPMRKHSLIRTR